MAEEDRLLELTLYQHRSSLTGAGSTSWLQNTLATPEGTAKVYERLQEKVESPAFLQTLLKASSTRVFTEGEEEAGSKGIPGADPSQEAWWEMVEAKEEPARPAGSPEPIDNYVMVDHEDVVDAVAYFIASYVTKQPQAQKMEPRQLQEALGLAFLELRKGQIRRLWDWGKTLYRCAATGYAALSMYTNPWLMQCLLSAMWTSSRVVCGLLI